MSLGTGTRLGPYEIQSALGAGGMGEVYRARDTKLNRDVALKVLPELFAADPDRLARFKREAQVLASLNHPNIGAIYGFEGGPAEAGPYGPGVGVQQPVGAGFSRPICALVLELVVGPTLADRIAQGPIPLDEALPIARQIADALEAAHEQGVVHRDLKPANVKLRPDGTVKVLDFGLAKALDPGAGSREQDPAYVLSQSPTMTSPAMTRMGVILGTATYMAPEQARGRTVDKRADIWAFGCVLFEMLTGTRAFDGEDVAETLGAVIHKEPAWGALPADTPLYLRTLLRRCLQKDPKKRLPHIGVARIEIDEGPADAAAPASVIAAPAPRGLRSNARIAWLVAGVSVAAAVALAVATFLSREAVDTRVVARASILPPTNAVLAVLAPGLRFTLSPDGQKLAFIGTGDGGQRLWVRPIEAVNAQPLAGTEGVGVARWSPDSRSLAFVAGGRLRKIDASGGTPITLADKATNWGLAWNAEDTILFVPDERGPLFRVSASGGVPLQVTTLDAASGDAGHGLPFFLPDGRHFLYLARGNPTDATAARVHVGSLDPAEEPRLVLPGGSNAQYASGYLLFVRDTTLMAQPFDADGLELTGEAVPLAEQLRVGGITFRTGAFGVSQTGTLVYQTDSADVRSQLVWFDRAGKQIDTLGDPADQTSVELSPDGTRVLFSLLDPARRTRDLWIYDVRRGLRTRFTFDPGNEMMGAWSPDGSRVVFNSRRPNRFDLYQKASNGAGGEDLLVSDDQDKEAYSWSQDGRFVAYHSLTASGRGTAQNLWTVPVAGDRKPAVFLQTEFGEFRPRFSPDGRWLAYTSTESGRREVYVVPFPDRSGKWQVSTAGGDWPRWRRDGKELFYLTPDNTLMAAAVSSEGTAFQVGTVQPLFEVRPRLGFADGYGYDVSADGQRFLVNTLLDEASSDPITLLVNWPALLTRR